MSSKTKIIVLHMREVVYTAVFLSSCHYSGCCALFHVRIRSEKE